MILTLFKGEVCSFLNVKLTICRFFHFPEKVLTLRLYIAIRTIGVSLGAWLPVSRPMKDGGVFGKPVCNNRYFAVLFRYVSGAESAHFSFNGFCCVCRKSVLLLAVDTLLL